MQSGILVLKLHVHGVLQMQSQITKLIIEHTCIHKKISRVTLIDM